MEFKSAYSPKERVLLECAPTADDPSRTKQSFKAECDINTIIKRYLRTGQLDFAARHEPRYGDATGQDFQAAMLTVAKAQTMFNDLPAALRARFGNDPAQFLDFVHDDKNTEEARELGLRKPVAVSPAAVASPPAPAPAPAPTEPAKAA